MGFQLGNVGGERGKDILKSRTKWYSVSLKIKQNYHMIQQFYFWVSNQKS